MPAGTWARQRASARAVIGWLMLKLRNWSEGIENGLAPTNALSGLPINEAIFGDLMLRQLVHQDPARACAKKDLRRPCRVHT